MIKIKQYFSWEYKKTPHYFDLLQNVILFDEVLIKINEEKLVKLNEKSNQIKIKVNLNENKKLKKAA